MPDPKIRWAEHKRAKGTWPFYNALRKYGVDGFIWEVLIVCSKEKLTVMEGYYAEQFETYVWDSPGGYNAVWCADNSRLGIKHTPEAIEKSRQASIGRKKSQEAIEKSRQAHLGRKNTPETIEKIRQSALGRKMSPESIEKTRQAKLGKKHSPETIENMRQAWVTRKMKYSTIVE